MALEAIGSSGYTFITCSDCTTGCFETNASKIYTLTVYVTKIYIITVSVTKIYTLTEFVCKIYTLRISVTKIYTLIVSMSKVYMQSFSSQNIPHQRLIVQHLHPFSAQNIHTCFYCTTSTPLQCFTVQNRHAYRVSVHKIYTLRFSAQNVHPLSFSTHILHL